jgi:hypothetical protein
MSIEEIIKELESISYQLDSTSNGFVENESDLSGAKNDLNYVIDNLEKEVIVENVITYEEIQIDGC